MRTSLALLPLLVIACDSPGGGGGGQVNCAVTPNAPICNPDVSDTVSPDTSAPDTSAPDTIDPDTTQPDTTQPDTTQPDTTQPDTTQPPECTGSSTRCSGSEAQVCSGGFWVTTAVCSGNTTCQSGSCVPTSVCTNGTRRCSGSTLEQCMNGQWAFAETCTNGCANNACTAPPTGNLSCFDTFGCIIDAGCFESVPTPPTSACTSPCLNQASTLGRNEMNAMLSCFSNCAYDGSCTIHQCSDERAACLFDVQGNRTCEQVYDCLLGCGENDTTCMDGCWESGSTTAQAQLEYALACYNAFCEDPESTLCSSNCSGALATCFP